MCSEFNAERASRTTAGARLRNPLRSARRRSASHPVQLKFTRGSLEIWALPDTECVDRADDEGNDNCKRCDPSSANYLRDGVDISITLMALDLRVLGQ